MLNSSWFMEMMSHPVSRWHEICQKGKLFSIVSSFFRVRKLFPNNVNVMRQGNSEVFNFRDLLQVLNVIKKYMFAYNVFYVCACLLSQQQKNKMFIPLSFLFYKSSIKGSLCFHRSLVMDSNVRYYWYRIGIARSRLVYD